MWAALSDLSPLPLLMSGFAMGEARLHAPFGDARGTLPTTLKGSFPFAMGEARLLAPFGDARGTLPTTLKGNFPCHTPQRCWCFGPFKT